MNHRPLPASGDSAVTHDRIERAEDESGVGDDLRENPSRNNVIDVSAGNHKREDESPRKGWWQRLLE